MRTLESPTARSVEVALFSGDRLRFDHLELPRALLHRYMLLFYLVLTSGLSQLQLYETLQPLSPGHRLGVVAACVFAAMSAIILAIVVLEVTQRPGTRRVLNATLFALVASFISTLSSEIFITRPPRTTLSGLLYFVIIWMSQFLIVQIGTHFVMLKMLRRVLRDMRGEAAGEPETFVPLGERIDIKGKAFVPGALMRITAEGNYIRVLTAEESHFLPGPFGPVVASLPGRLGMQVSRSEWVARAAVAGARRSGRDLTLELIEGSTVRVAQAKRKAVEEWLDGGQGGGSDEGAKAKSTQTGK